MEKPRKVLAIPLNEGETGRLTYATEGCGKEKWRRATHQSKNGPVDTPVHCILPSLSLKYSCTANFFSNRNSACFLNSPSRVSPPNSLVTNNFTPASSAASMILYCSSMSTRAETTASWPLKTLTRELCSSGAEREKSMRWVLWTSEGKVAVEMERARTETF